MNLFDSLTISGSALAAERQRSEIVAANMANAETTHTEAGGPYRRKEVVFRVLRRIRFPAGSGQHGELEHAHRGQRADF